MEKRNTLDQRFINLRQIFHQFQTTVRFSTANSAAQLFANQLKCYQFLGELQQHFISQKVQYLYEFIHSIFSLIFTMIRQGPSQRSQKLQNAKTQSTIHISTQTDQINPQIINKLQSDPLNLQSTKHKKRNCLEIQIFEKDLTDMSFRQRRRALQKMRDIIYSEDDQTAQPNSIMKDFKPNIDKVAYSRSDQSIKSAIDKFKESDISTHIFLKDFMQEFIEIKDVKSSAQLLNKDLIQSMSKAITKYKGMKVKGKQKFKVFSHTVQEIIYPTINIHEYRISINQIKNQTKSLNTTSQITENQVIHSFLQNLQNLPKIKINNSNSKLKIGHKRNKFPSLMLNTGQSLNTISQQKSQSSIESSKSSIQSKKGKKKLLKTKIRSSFSQNQTSNKPFNTEQLRNNSKKQILSNKIPSLPQRNRSQSRFRPKDSFVLNNNRQTDKSNLLEKQKQNIKQKQALNSNKLRKRTGSQYFDKIQNQMPRKSFQIT